MDRVNQNIDDPHKIIWGEVFDRICEVRGISQAKLGEMFGKTPQSMSQHRANNTFDLRLLAEKFWDEDWDYLLKGIRSSVALPLQEAVRAVEAAGLVVLAPGALKALAAAQAAPEPSQGEGSQS